MLQWLRQKLGVTNLERMQNKLDFRIIALEKLAEGGSYEEYIETKNSHKAGHSQRYDEVERARARRNKCPHKDIHG